MSRIDSFDMDPFSNLDQKKAGDTLDALIDLVSDLLPVTSTEYPAMPADPQINTVEFCLRHSALHFSKTAGRLAAWVEDADHGKYAEINALEAIVAASLVNSLKLADEIGVSGPDIVDYIKAKYAVHDRAV